MRKPKNITKERKTADVTVFALAEAPLAVASAVTDGSQQQILRPNTIFMSMAWVEYSQLYSSPVLKSLSNKNN